MIHEIYKRISELKMEYKTSRSNRARVDTPDVLYSKYIGLVVGLPDAATKWPLPLCTVYYSALVITLQDKIDEESFNIPSHSVLQTKTLQIQALRTVREAAVKEFKPLNDEDKHLRKLIGSINDN